MNLFADPPEPADFFNLSIFCPLARSSPGNSVRFDPADGFPAAATFTSQGGRWSNPSFPGVPAIASGGGVGVGVMIRLVWSRESNPKALGGWVSADTMGQRDNVTKNRLQAVEAPSA
jgi:hypothetical protein